MTLTISLPADAESKLQACARAAGQDMTQYVEQLLACAIAGKLLQAEDNEAALDARYARGYAMIPEDIAEVNALLPHLAVDTERWE